MANEEPAELYIVRVELPDASMRSARVLDEQARATDTVADEYDVLIYFNRRVDDFERAELSDFHIQRGTSDTMLGLIQGTTLEAIRDRLDDFNGALASAAARAHKVRQAAEVEDAKLKEVMVALNKELMAKHRSRYVKE